MFRGEESEEALIAAMQFHRVMRLVIEFVEAHRKK